MGRRAAMFIVVLASCSGVVEEETSTYHICRVCGSGRATKDIVVAGIRTRVSDEVESTPVFSELLAGRHEHEWTFCSRDTVRSDGTWIHGDGFPALDQQPNRFTERFNRNGAFRRFVLERIGAGVVTREFVAGLVLLNDDDFDGSSPDVARARRIFHGLR